VRAGEVIGGTDEFRPRARSGPLTGVRSSPPPGLDPERRDYGSFEDPDGNGWLLQEVRRTTPREVI
jgi:hypothetical protein